MQYRVFSFPSRNRSLWAVVLAVAFAAAFFVVAGTQPARAQSRVDRPDLRITKASFNGRDLHVEYANAAGVYDRRRYEVGFQWYDAAGRPVGERHWLPQPEVERGGVAILDTKYRIDLTYRRSGGNYNRRLLDFILQRPNDAEELRVTVDDGDRIPEMDETNNVASLKIPLPDLQITGAKFLSPNRLELSYRNANPSPIPLPFRIGFTWAEEGGAYVNATRWINVLEPAAGETKTEALSRTDASYITASGRQAGDRLDWYFERRPGNATRMKITIDDAGTVREQNEQNNLVTVRPFLPDLVVRDARLDGERLTFTYGNDGEGPIRDTASRVLVQWVDATGKPIGGPRWIGFAQMDPKQTFAVNADRFDVEYAVAGTNRTTTQRLSSYLRERPAGATQLTMTIDDERRIIEANEANNSATVTFATALQPDLTLEQFTVTNERPSFTYRNRGGPTPADQRIPIVLEWLDARGSVLPLRLESDLGALTAGELRSFVSGAALRKWRVTDGRRDGDGDTVFFLAFQEPARGATALRITIDPANAIPERDEQNNALTVPISRADFSIRDPRFNGTELSFTYAASGSDPVVRPPLSLWFEWADASGARVGDLAWSDVAFLFPGTSRAFRSADARVGIGAADGSSRVLSLREFLAKPSVGAQGLRVFVDGPNRYDEPDETDNVVLLPIPPPPGKPDLVVERIAIVDGQPQATVWNKGSGKASSVVVAHEYRDRAGKPLGGGSRETAPLGLGADQKITDAILGTIPDAAATVAITVDPANAVAESDEQNNAKEAPAPMADLVVVEAQPTPNGTLALTYRNAGNRKSGSISIWLHFADAQGAQVGPLYWMDVSPLRVGGTQVLANETEHAFSSAGAVELQSIFALPPAGATHVKIVLDGPDRIVEADEGNNAVLLAKPVGPLPDLAIADLALTADQATWRMRNVGDPIPPTQALTFVVEFQWLDQTGVAVGPSAGINSDIYFPTPTYVHNRSTGYSGSASSDYILRRPSGAVALRVTEDSANVIREKDETNNVAEVALPRPPQPDLAFARVTAKWDGRDPKIEYVGTNRGTADVERVTLELQWLDASGRASGPSYAPFEVFGRLRAGATSSTWALPFWDSGETSTRPLGRYLLLPPSDATHLRLMLDPENAVPESDEANNTAVVERPANVPLSDLTITNARLVEGAFALTYQNIGPVHAGYFMTLSTWFEWVDASGNRVGDLVWHDGESLDPRYATHLDAATAVSSAARAKFPLREFFAAPPSGATHLKVTVDGPNTLLESNEANNETRLVRPTVPLPDLAFTNVFLVPPKRERLVIGFQNAGKAAAPEFSWAMSWVDAADKRVGTPYEGVVPALKPNWRFGVGSDLNESDPKGKPMPRGAWLHQPKPDGAARLEIIIDPENAIVESDEANNRQMFDEWVPPKSVEPEKRADLRIADFTMDPAAPRAGERVWFVVRVENVGSAATGMQTATGIIVDPEKSGTDRRIIGQFTAADIPSGKSFTHRWTKENYYGWVAVAGTHTIEVCADRAKVVSEGDETNNCAQKVVTVEALVDERSKRPDLSVGAVEVKDGALRITARNVGGESSALTDIWLMWFAGSRPLSSSAAVDLPAIAAGKEAMVVVSFDGKTEASQILREPPKDGTRVRIFLDGSRKVAEQNEDNNDAMLDRAKLSPSDPSKLPDLSYNGRPFVTNFTSSPPELIVSIKNGGKGPTDPFVWQMQWLDRAEKPLGDAYRAKHSGLPPGSFYGAVHTTRDSYALGVPMGTYVTKIPAGAATLEVVLDPDGALAESDEGNNRATLAAKDLAILGNKRPTANAGDDITERDDDGDGVATVRFYGNRSKDPDGKIVSWKWTLDDKEIASGEFPYWREAPVGKRTVTLTVTDDKGLTATDTVRVTVESKPATPPDLVVAELTFEPRVPQVGDVVAFTARVENRGGSRVGQVSVTSLDIDVKNDNTRDGQLAQFVTKDLDRGASETHHWKREYGRDYTWTAVAGTHAFLVCADAKGVVVESDDWNNCTRRVVTVGATEDTTRAPDLAFRVFLRDTTSYAYATQIDNIGDADAPAYTWEMQWVDADRKPIGPSARYTFNRTLNVGKSVGNSVQYRKGASNMPPYDAYTLNPPAGAVMLRLTVDPDNAIAEKNEMNNSITLDPPPAPKPTTSSKPDLVVEQVFVLPSKPTANAKTEFAAIIRNIGGAPAGDSVAYVVLDLGNDNDPDQAPDPLEFPALKAGASFAKTWPDAEVLPEGTHAVEVCADVGEEVAEANEKNNCREMTFTVVAPARTSLLLLPIRLVLDVFSTPIRAGTME